MKRLLILLALCASIVASFGQTSQQEFESGVPDSLKYVLPQFALGQVVYKDGTYSAGKFNISTIDQSIRFIDRDGSEKALVDGSNVDRVTISVGNITSTMPLDKVERISPNEYKAATKAPEARSIQRVNEDLNARRLKFSPELDVRGARLQEAMDIVMHYIDDAVMLNVGSVRIIHGKGTGVLRDELQKYLRTVPGIASVRDEQVQFGGSGVTVVTF